ncbi:MAG TPA: M14 metallopeptidase family protein [Vicinamibacterales bacterium]|nr:M14 metallopeptidase family protein [Vicinamibacterales bacterium]
MPVLTRTRAFIVLMLALLPAPQARTQQVASITTPQRQFGAAIGDDYFLATYTQLEDYWKTLDRESDRMQVVDIGRTEEGRRQWMAIVSSPENLKQLERYKEISRRLSLAEGLTDAQARALAAEGKAVVWINGGLHANEVLGAQQLIETIYQLVSRSDGETLRFLRDVIVLAVDANPDGHELVANWYMREKDPSLRTLAGIPRAYQKYIGHDNNRDFYLASQAETININRILYREWFPQIVYDHHQTGPAGTVMFAPPFRDPFNYVLDPLIPVGIDLVGAAMHARFALEAKPGVTMRTGSTYSTWWNGGLRTTAYFHNQIGLLTETIGSPTPTEIPFVPDRQLPSADLPYPIAPQRWRFRQSIEYSVTANRAVIDVASRFRETLLFNVYRMGQNSIRRGSQDSWTISPHRLEGVKVPAGGRGAAAQRLYEQQLRAPQFRDPRGYVLPSDQPDFLTATKFVDALIKTGITVHRATTAFAVNGRSYPAGSYVVKTAQAFRPHVLDMFEPQDHPDDIPYPGGPPTPPYDSAGWTLALQMGVKFDRLLEGFDGPFEKLTAVSHPAGRVIGPASPAGYLLSHHQNDAFIAVNRLMKAGEEVYWPVDRATGGGANGTGAMYVTARPSTLAVLQKAAIDVGLTFIGVSAPPPGDGLKLRPVRIGLWDRYGGSSPSGWTRWMLERYEFPFEVVYAQTLDSGSLASRFDVIVLTSEAVLSRGLDEAPVPDRLPPEYRGTTGVISRARTLPQLKQFVEDGGTLVAIGGSTSIAAALGLPVSSALVETGSDGARPLTREQYYIPGSLLRVRVDNTTPLGYGFEPDVDVFFDNSPVFRLAADAGKDTRRVAWFASAAPLRSGWAWGQRYLDGGVAVVDTPLGRGRVLLFGPEINFRAQPHGTFKFLFNGIYYGKAVATRIQ